ncbi:hypothetical protein ACGFJT_20630 [Actinomadura geliboluensis]|uniref:hypothetical protein n=1 Tax=Actinomadura geliboluensis TaxID=882440 RepID=UPI00371D8B23
MAIVLALCAVAPVHADALIRSVSSFKDMNDSGVVVGSTSFYIDGSGSPVTHAVRWEPNGSPTRLPDLPGKKSAAASGINNTGTIVGTSGSSAVKWSASGSVTALANLPGGWSARAVGVNDAGVVIGEAVTQSGLWRPVRWNPDGTIAQLPMLSSTGSIPVAVNQDGVIVGYGLYAGGDHWQAVRWGANGAITALPNLPGGNSAIAHGINDNGAIAGEASDSAGNWYAVRWSANGTITQLPYLPGGDGARAWGINDAGVVVGQADLPGRRRAVRWNADGTIVPLADLSGEWASGAKGINATGTIAGEASDNSGAHVVRWSAGGAINVLPDPPRGLEFVPTIRRDSATGAPYSGRFRARSLTDSLGAVYVVHETPDPSYATCMFAQIDGHLTSDGTGTAIDGVRMGNDGNGQACPNSLGGTTTISAVGIQGTGTIYHAPDSDSGRDGFLQLDADNPQFQIEITVTAPGTLPQPITCTYGLSAEVGANLRLFNRYNSQRPDLGTDELQTSTSYQGLTLTKTDGGDCGDELTILLDAKITGEKVAGSGVYDQSLFLTGAS